MIHRTFAPLALAVVAMALALALGSTPAAAENLINFTVDLDVAQVTTPTGVGASGSGTAAVSFDNVSNVLTWELKFSGLADGPQSAVAAHFHIGAVGVAGLIAIDISNAAFKSPTAGSATSADLQNGQVFDDLIAGDWYINVHSTNSPSGEIRGQVLPGGGGVGGVAELPEAAGAPLQATGSSGGNAGLIAGLIVAVVAGTVALGGAACWYARRRWAQ